MAARSWIVLLLLSLIWGCSFVFIEILLEVFHPFLLVFLRVSLACTFLGSYLKAKGEKLSFSLRDLRTLLFMGFFGVALPFTLISLGQVSISGGLSAIFNSTTAFFGVLTAALFLRDEPLHWERILGVLLGIFGVTIAVGIENLLQLSFQEYGQFLVLGAGLSYAFAAALGKRNLKHLGSAKSSFGMLLCASFMSGLYVLFNHTSVEAFPNFIQIASLLTLSIVGTGIAYLMYFHLLGTAGASNTTLVTILAPIWAVLGDAFFLGQVLEAKALLGFGFLVLGLIVLDGRVLCMLLRRFSKVQREYVEKL